MVVVAPATQHDIAGWIELAVEVDELFGTNSATPGFRVWLQRCIEYRSAICARIKRRLVGGVQFSEGRIHWLGVRPEQRGLGVGEALVGHVLGDRSQEVSVVTFGRDHPHPESTRTREFYSKLGFRPTGETRPAVSDGSPREVLVWSP